MGRKFRNTVRKTKNTVVKAAKVVKGVATSPIGGMVMKGALAAAAMATGTGAALMAAKALQKAHSMATSDAGKMALGAVSRAI
jgi:hypothetical protein